jgi:hypothetical protein
VNINPELLIEMVATTIPKSLHGNILVVGSLAAAYHNRTRLGAQAVNTKDADVIVHPAGAVSECAEIAKQLLLARWRRTDRCHPRPTSEPTDDLRAIRLHPPDSDAFFIELLGLPKADDPSPKTWVPCELDDGWYGMPCFRYMALLASDRRDTPFGIQHGSPPLMALANLLSHPGLGTTRMETEFGPGLLRSTKDLGRVLALAWLEPPDELDKWPELFAGALRKHFPDDASKLANSAGTGLRQLLDAPEALEEAHVTTRTGLLGGVSVTVDQLEITGERFMMDVLGPLVDEFS